MEFGIVHFGEIAYDWLSSPGRKSKIAGPLPYGKTRTLWKNSLKKLGCDVDAPEPNAEDLFMFVKSFFEKEKKTSLDIKFVTAYVEKKNGAASIFFDKASRLFSRDRVVYVDELILTSLFEYVSAYYLWAVHPDEVAGFWFQYVGSMLNYACRIGIMTSDDNKEKLVAQIVSRCGITALNLIADLYWSCLAFAYCHEIAHIYLNHIGTKVNNQEELWNQEFEADAVGYDIYLKMIERVKEDPDIPFSGVFHDYLYAAPMILFQFYEDKYFLGYWLFGEKIGDTHPPLRERSNALLDISQQALYSFDTEEGNAVLSNYMDVSEWYREQLILKLERGKMHKIIQEGNMFMNELGYENSIEFQQSMYDMLTREAERRNIDSGPLIGLWDIAVDIELLNEPSENSFVWSYQGKTYSTKAFNVKFSLLKLLQAVLKCSFTIGSVQTSQGTVLAGLLILRYLLDITTHSLNDEHASILITCYNLRAYEHPVDEKIVIKASKGTIEAINELEKLGCIEVVEGKIILLESIHIA